MKIITIKNIVLSILISMSVVACEKDSVVEVPVTNPELVTACFLSPSADETTLRLLWSAPIFHTTVHDNPEEEDAKVYINDGVNSYQMMYNHSRQLYAINNNNLKIVEDCAHSTWWKYKWKMLWSMWDLGCFSFHGVKNMTTWDGWMITTNNKEYYEKLKKLRWVWMDKDTFDRENSEGYSWYYNIDCLGYKYHMNDISAAIWIEQLKKVDAMNKRRREISEKYNRELINVDWIELPVMKNYADSSNHNYVIKVKNRNELNKYLAEKWISTGVHYIPNNHYNMYKKYWNDTPVTEEIWTKLLSLPIYPTLTEIEQDEVIKEIKNFNSI